MPHLYVNTKGIPHQSHSFSAGNDYEQSPLKYYLKRVLGWREKDLFARLVLGRAIEQAVEFFHNNDGRGIIEKFTELWGPAKDQNLVYTKLEKNWETCLRMGVDWSKLYIIKQPSFPIPLGGASVFQRKYGKEVFPGDPNYGQILDEGKLDIVCYVDPKHPLLVPREWKPEDGPLRPHITDMKTSGVDYDERPGMPAFDKQLRRYSWQSGIQDVSFLTFVKKSLGYKKGSRITLLEDKGVFKAGTEMFVVSKHDDGACIVSSKMALIDMEAAQGRKADGSLDTTKAATLRKSIWIENNALSVDDDEFTRQRIQFNSGYVFPSSAQEAGVVAGRQIVSIVNSYKNNDWPNDFGIRYPKDDRHDPYFRAFVLNDEAYKSENFKLANPEEMDELFDDEPEGEDEGE